MSNEKNKNDGNENISLYNVHLLKVFAKLIIRKDMTIIVVYYKLL